MTNVVIVGVADLNPWAPGIELARRLNVRVTTDFRELIADAGVDLVIDVTGDAEVSEAIQQLKTPSTEVMGELEDRYSLAVRELQAQASSDFILGQNPKMREVAELLARVAPTLMESELFGRRRGAFTGAIMDKVGFFEKADGGTIFLDEIGDMPLEVQGKLLRVLQAGEIKPVGDVVTRRVRVRVIAATNRVLESRPSRSPGQAQWTLERLKAGYPTESHHVMARAEHF